MNVPIAILETVLLATHLLCVNVAMMGPLACSLLRIRATRRDDSLADQAGRALCNVCMWALLIAIILGLISGLILWFGNQPRFFEALRRIPPRRLYWGIAELAFYFLCMFTYYGLWNRWRQRLVFHSFVAVVAATNLIYHFPPLFIAINAMASTGVEQQAPLETRELMKLMFNPGALARLAHHLVAAVAGTAVWLMLVVEYISRNRPGNSHANEDVQRTRLLRLSAITALVVSLVQLPVGLWLLFKLPAAEREMILGGSWVAIGLFVAAMICVLALLHSLSLIALGQTERRDVINVAVLLVLVTTLMTGVLRMARSHEVVVRATVQTINREELTQRTLRMAEDTEKL